MGGLNLSNPQTEANHARLFVPNLLMRCTAVHTCNEKMLFLTQSQLMSDRKGGRRANWRSQRANDKVGVSTWNIIVGNTSWTVGWEQQVCLCVRGSHLYSFFTVVVPKLPKSQNMRGISVTMCLYFMFGFWFKDYVNALCTLDVCNNTFKSTHTLKQLSISRQNY